MKNLYIIGNGFDRHHEMNTSYEHFHQWLIQEDSDVLNTIAELFGECDSEWWEDFEDSLSSAITSDIVDEAISDNYPDFSSDDFRDSEWEDAKYDVDNILQYAYKDIRKEFQQWIATMPKGNENKKIKINVDDSVFLSFNYTHTLEDLYNIDSQKILHIHGKAGTDDELVLGHGASKNDIRDLVDDDCFVGDDEVDGDIIRVNAVEGAIDAVYNQRKKVEEIITTHQKWFNSLNSVTNIYCYGHGLADVDLPYFKKIFSTVDKTKIKVEFSDFNHENEYRIKELMRNEGIGQQQYSIIDLNSILVKP